MSGNFEKIVVVGTGLLGGSLALDIKAKRLAQEVVGVCRSQRTAELAVERGVVDRCETLEEALKGCHLLVLATPMLAMLPVLATVAKHIEADTVITDVGSVKTDLYREVKHHHPELISRFVFAHPIAGSEQSGVSAAKPGLFVNKNVIVTKTDETDPRRLQRVAQLWQHTGAKVLEMGLAEHDAVFARTSHLPHVVAFTLVNYLNQQDNRAQLFDMAAAGFYDFTRIASSDAEMWRDICITNQAEVLAALEGFAGQVDNIRSLIAEGDEAGILAYFSASKEARDAGLLKKARSLLDEAR